MFKIWVSNPTENEKKYQAQRKFVTTRTARLEASFAKQQIQNRRLSGASEEHLRRNQPKHANLYIEKLNA